jgi:hypothetical protein
METINKYFPAKADYERMQYCSVQFTNVPYAEFIEWNHKCLQKLSDSEVTWIEKLCQKISMMELGLVDLEHCNEWFATGIYFNKHSDICIFHPR